MKAPRLPSRKVYRALAQAVGVPAAGYRPPTYRVRACVAVASAGTPLPEATPDGMVCPPGWTELTGYK